MGVANEIEDGEIVSEKQDNMKKLENELSKEKEINDVSIQLATHNMFHVLHIVVDSNGLNDENGSMEMKKLIIQDDVLKSATDVDVVQLHLKAYEQEVNELSFFFK